MAWLLVLAGVATLVSGFLQFRRHAVRSVAERISMPYSDDGYANGSVSRGTFHGAVAQLSPRGRGAESHEPKLNTGHVASIAVVAGVVALTVFVVVGQVILAIVAGLAVVLLQNVMTQAARRRVLKMAHEQAPAALSTLASSLEAGASLEHSLAVLSREIGGPLGAEFERLVVEVELGADVQTAIVQMAERLGSDDLRWWAYAVGLQRRVGGRLAPITRNLADIIRERAELRQEIQVLTAEGRLSAGILGGLPVAIFVVLQVMNPSYLQPFYQGWGVVWLALTAASVVLGVFIVLRMVQGTVEG
ncbi:MAG: type II secretion system F family protein [Acidimicrobiia bacterium]